MQPIRAGFIVSDGYIAAKVGTIPAGLPTATGAWHRSRGDWAGPKSTTVLASIDRHARNTDHLDAWPLAPGQNDDGRGLFTDPGDKHPRLWAWANGEEVLWFNARVLDILHRLIGRAEYDWTCNGFSSPLIAWDARGIWRGMVMPVSHGFPLDGLEVAP